LDESISHSSLRRSTTELLILPGRMAFFSNSQLNWIIFFSVISRIHSC